MLKVTTSLAAVALLTACTATPTVTNFAPAAPGQTVTTGGLNNTGFLYNGNNIPFVNSGATSCPNGVVAVPGYPLRCGPQSQVTPR